MYQHFSDLEMHLMHLKYTDSNNSIYNRALNELCDIENNIEKAILFEEVTYSEARNLRYFKYNFYLAHYPKDSTPYCIASRIRKFVNFLYKNNLVEEGDIL